MFEFVCDRIIPGCTHKESGDTVEEVRELARTHLHEHHGMEYLDESWEQRLGSAIVLGGMRP
ncbi:MAG: DUF1059 domain-containing protein [Acidimicrobiia bacterium]|jgi:predicted small metal-binding protein